MVEKHEKETTTKYVISKETEDFKNLSKLVKMKLRFTKSTSRNRDFCENGNPKPRTFYAPCNFANKFSYDVAILNWVVY